MQTTPAAATPPPSEATYVARWGYRDIDVARYERRRYGSALRRLKHRALERALARALRTVPRDGIVLDLPCGTGVLTPMLRRLGLRVLAADISPAMLARQQERGHVVGCVRADAERIGLRADAVDAIVCVRFYLHLPPAIRPVVLAELGRVSRGPVVVVVTRPWTLKAGLRALRRRLGLEAPRGCAVGRKELAAEAAAAGLRLDRLRPVFPGLSALWVAELT